MSHHNVSHDVEHFFKSHVFIKSLAAGVVAACLDNYLNASEGYRMNPQIISGNVAFGSIVGGSIFASNYIAPSLTHLIPIPDTALFSGKTLEHRLIEVGLGTGGAVLLNQTLRTNYTTLMTQAGIIVLADVVGEYVGDYAKSTPLSYLH
jgi:hypothetical protein